MNSMKITGKTGTYKTSLNGIIRIFTATVLLLIQFILILLISYFSTRLIAGEILILFIEIANVVIILSLINDRSRSHSYKIGWLCIILLLPLIGHVMYALWGNRVLIRKYQQKIKPILHHGIEYLQQDETTSKSIKNDFSLKYPDKVRMVEYLEAQKYPLFKNNQIVYYPFAEDFFTAFLDDIKKAERFILIHFFIIAQGSLWDKIHELLVDKLKTGVSIKIMFDDFGSSIRLPKNFRKTLEQDGIEVCVYNPVIKNNYKFNRIFRNHQKLAIIDGNIAYTGGMNIGDEYINLVERHGIWKDNAIRVEGDAVWGFTVIFLQMWEVCNPGVSLNFNQFRPAKRFPENDVFCHVLFDGPVNNPDNPMEISYQQIIQYAKEYVYIATPYLILDEDMIRTLMIAAKSGIDVRIITPHIADKKYSKALTIYNYGPLLKAGVKIYEYKPGFIHEKTIFNEECGIVGTANMDFRSFYLDYECGLWMCSREIIQILKEDFDKTIENSIIFTDSDWKARPWYIKLCQPVLNLFSTLM